MIPDVVQLFDEPGILDQAARLARDWFLAHRAWLSGSPGPTEPGTVGSWPFGGTDSPHEVLDQRPRLDRRDPG